MVDWQPEEFDADFGAAKLFAAFFVDGKVVGLATVMEEEFEINGKRVFTIGFGKSGDTACLPQSVFGSTRFDLSVDSKVFAQAFEPIVIWGAV